MSTDYGRSGNPVLKEDTFTKHGVSDDPMTLNGVVHRTGFLLLLLVMAASWTWGEFWSGGFAAVKVPMWTGIIGSLVVAIATVLRPAWAPTTAPLYALLQGLALGAISANFEQRYEGIVIQAVGLTFATLAMLLLAYRSGLIRATENFKLGVTAATGAIAVYYLIDLGLSFFAGRNAPMIHESGWLGIGFSLFAVTIAAFNLVLDFDFVETGVEQRAPKHMEWFAAFGLIVTLAWLYLELLRLLGKSRD